MEIKLNRSNNNPFYGMRNCLALLQNQGGNITESLLNSCWQEVKDDKIKRELFFSLLFSIGDITARQHNIFGKTKRDSGGNANREGFYTIFLWLKDNHKAQFIKFLRAGLFNEYTCFDILFRSRVQTKGCKVLKVYDCFSDPWYRKQLAEYVYAVVNGTNPFNKLLVAKFLTLPRLSKRAGHKKMLPETKKVMENKAGFLMELSDLCGWEYSHENGRMQFPGYRKWRQQFNGSLESVLFSSGKIMEFDKPAFLDWYDKLPSQARFRVKNRIMYSTVEGNAETKDKKVSVSAPMKWAKLQPWVKEWETYKEEKQAEQRVLEEKVRQNQATEEDKERLAKVKKEAKVNVGATNFKELYEQILKGTVDRLKLEAFMNKVNLPYNSLVICDDSGSMNGAPFNFATFIAAVCLCKNPDDDARNLLGFFNTQSHWHGFIDCKAQQSPNMLLRRSVIRATQPFVDPTKSFIENFKNINEFCHAVFQGGCTNISSIPDGLKMTCDYNPAILDAIKSYPVWTIISDGEWNNLSSPEASINDFFRKCENWFGFRPFIVAIDIESPNSWSPRLRNSAERFSGIDNMIYIPSNPAQIEQFLTNFKDMDVFDVYTPLQSLYRSNRYEPVRENTL